MPLVSHKSHINDLRVSKVILSSPQLPIQEADCKSPYGPCDHSEQPECVPQPVQSPTPQRRYLLPYAYGSRGAMSSQDIGNIGTLTVEERDVDATGMSYQFSKKLALSSSIMLPLSQHGLVRNSSRVDLPNSRTPQPVKISSPHTPVNTAPPDYSRPSSPPLRTILPMSTASVQRWNRNIVVPTDVTYCLVDPLKFKFDDDAPPFGWISYTHPEGARYFFHEEKRIYTDANLYDPEELVVITESADQILGDLESKARDENISLPSDIELVLEIVPGDNEVICGYYFVEHGSRCLFWLEEFDAAGICEEIKAVVSLSHLRYEIESQYWTHWELFPNTRDLTPDLVDELRDIVLHAATDTITSGTSTALWNTEQNQTILNLLNNVKMYSGKRRGYSACVVGRLMRNLTHNQFVHLYGQRGARLDSDQSAHGSVVNPKSLLVMILSPFLFWAPDVHLQALEKIWVDRQVHIGHWTKFTNKLNTEWQQTTIIVIVLLNANMTFLSISSPDPGNNMVENIFAAQIASYLSTVTSLGCLILSLLLVRQAKCHETAQDAANFLGSMTHATRGLETLAILYALPYALLMWSTLCFLVAIIYTCFSSNLATRFLVGAVLVVVGLLVVLCIRAGWINESKPPHLRQSRSDNLGEYRRAMSARDTTHDVKAQERKASTNIVACGGDSAEAEKRRRRRQRSWPLMVFVRKPTPDSLIGAVDNETEKVEV